MKARSALAVAGVLLVSLVGPTAAAQSRDAHQGTPPAFERVLARGWVALADGKPDAAVTLAAQALALAPSSMAAASLSVEAAIAQGGAASGLDAYERWLASRRLDAAHLLRRVASAYLSEFVRGQDRGVARIVALEALVDDGDPHARASLMAAGPTGPLEARLLASMGDENAVRVLVTRLETLPNKAATIDALVESESTLAIPPLIELLGDPRDEYRAAAADALGRLGAQEAVPQLRALLENQSFPVRMMAAKALYRLGDDSGASLLDELLRSEHAAVRLGAAEALSVRPEGGWQAVARNLAETGDEAIQLQAARLLAPYDRELAERVLGRLRQSKNPAMREEAGKVLVERVAGDFTALRRLLREGESATIARAAARILELTR